MRYDTLTSAFNELSTYLSGYKVISEGELLLEIKVCVESLSDLDREELRRKIGENLDLEEAIFRSITTREEKISVFSPDMHTRINYQGEVFYCLPAHKYLSDELENAFLRWAEIRSPLSVIANVVTEFMKRCGYPTISWINDKDYEEHLEIVALKNNSKRTHIFTLPTIKSVPSFISANPMLMEKSETAEENVIAVPTEKTPAPFISFFREQDVGDAMIWVVDVKRYTIDPFIGIPEDSAIEHNFANPKQARRAVSIWMKRMQFADL